MSPSSPERHAIARWRGTWQGLLRGTPGERLAAAKSALAARRGALIPPFWRDRVLVGFAPERLSALCTGGLPRPRLLDRHSVALYRQSAGGWDKSLAALDALLTEPGWKGRDIAILLSAHYVRHVVMPPSAGLAEDERQALARVVFRETFGDIAQDWDLRISPAPAGQATLACGVPRSLLTALRTTCAERGRLVSIQPSLMPVFKRARPTMGQGQGCLALVEAGRITVAMVAEGQWRSIDSRAGDGDLLPQLLLEEGELHGRQPGGILWLCDLTDAARLPVDTLWTQQRIVPPGLPGLERTASLAGWGLA